MRTTTKVPTFACAYDKNGHKIQREKGDDVASTAEQPNQEFASNGNQTDSNLIAGSTSNESDDDESDSESGVARNLFARGDFETSDKFLLSTPLRRAKSAFVHNIHSLSCAQTAQRIVAIFNKDS